MGNSFSDNLKEAYLLDNYIELNNDQLLSLDELINSFEIFHQRNNLYCATCKGTTKSCIYCNCQINYLQWLKTLQSYNNTLINFNKMTGQISV